VTAKKKANLPPRSSGFSGYIPAEPLLISFECFIVFTDPSGEKLAANRKSLGYRSRIRLSSKWFARLWRPAGKRAPVR